jgi:hypothetical protein
MRLRRLDPASVTGAMHRRLFAEGKLDRHLDARVLKKLEQIRYVR